MPNEVQHEVQHVHVFDSPPDGERCTVCGISMEEWDNKAPKLNVKTYGIGFEVPKEMGEGLIHLINERQFELNQQLWNDAFLEPRPFVPPTRRQRLRTWLATKLLKVVGWLDYEVIPW